MLINIIKIVLLSLLLNYFLNRKIKKELFVNNSNKNDLLKKIIKNRRGLEELYKKKINGNSLKEIINDREKTDELNKKNQKKKNINFDITSDLNNLELEDYYKLKSTRSGRKLLFEDIEDYCYYDKLGNYKCDDSDIKKDYNINKKKLLGLDVNKNLKDLGLNQIELDNLYRKKFDDLILKKIDEKHKENGQFLENKKKINFDKNDSNCYYDTLGKLMCFTEGKNSILEEDNNNKKLDKNYTIEMQENNEKKGKTKKVKLFFKKNEKIYYKIEGGDIDNFTKDNTLCIIICGYNKNSPENIIINIHPEDNKIFLPLIDENKYNDDIDSYFVYNNENMFDRKLIHYFTFYDNGYVIYKKKIIYENTFFDIDTKIAKYYEVTDILGTDKKKKTRFMNKWDGGEENFNNLN